MVGKQRRVRHVWYIQLILWACGWGIFLPFVGCHQLYTCTNTLQTKPQIRGMWNSIQRIQDPQQLKVWLSRLLSQMLQDGAYQLEQAGESYMIVDPKENHHNRCRVDIKEQLKQLNDPEFLRKLYRIIKRHKIQLENFVYRPPKAYTVQGESTGTNVSGGDCIQRKYRAEAAYWKTISGKYMHSYWPQACALGRRLKKWEGCFNAKFRAIFQQRMKEICGQ